MACHQKRHACPHAPLRQCTRWERGFTQRACATGRQVAACAWRRMAALAAGFDRSGVHACLDRNVFRDGGKVGHRVWRARTIRQGLHYSLYLSGCTQTNHGSSVRCRGRGRWGRCGFGGRGSCGAGTFVRQISHGACSRTFAGHSCVRRLRPVQVLPCQCRDVFCCVHASPACLMS